MILAQLLAKSSKQNCARTITCLCGRPSEGVCWQVSREQKKNNSIRLTADPSNSSGAPAYSPVDRGFVDRVHDVNV